MRGKIKLPPPPDPPPTLKKLWTSHHKDAKVFHFQHFLERFFEFFRQNSRFFNNLFSFTSFTAGNKFNNGVPINNTSKVKARGAPWLGISGCVHRFMGLVPKNGVKPLYVINEFI